MTKVININSKSNYDIFIGREKKSNYHYGNPFVLKDSREECINKFNLWLYGIAYSNVEPKRRKWILNNMQKLKDCVLGCYCKPKKCHGDIYVEILDNIGYSEFMSRVK